MVFVWLLVWFSYGFRISHIPYLMCKKAHNHRLYKIEPSKIVYKYPYFNTISNHSMPLCLKTDTIYLLPYHLQSLQIALTHNIKQQANLYNIYL